MKKIIVFVFLALLAFVFSIPRGDNLEECKKDCERRGPKQPLSESFVYWDCYWDCVDYFGQ